MRIPPVSKNFQNVYCGGNIRQQAVRKIVDRPILDKKYSYSTQELNTLEEQFYTTKPYFSGEDFSMRKKDNSATIIVKNDHICAYSSNNAITLNVKPGLFKDTEHYFGMINDTQVQFTSKTHKGDYGEYEIDFKNVENIDKEVLDMVAVQKLKKFKNKKYIECNFNLMVLSQK